MNTFFQKPDIKLATYQFTRTTQDDDCYRGTYETLDYVLCQDRWKNTVIDTESDVYAALNTDHFPFISHIRIKFKNIKTNKTQPRLKYDECNPLQNLQLNLQWEFEWDNRDTNQTTYHNIKNISKKKIKQHLPKRHAKQNKKGISDDLRKILDQRSQAYYEHDWEKHYLLQKQAKKLKQSEKNNTY